MQECYRRPPGARWRSGSAWASCTWSASPGAAAALLEKAPAHRQPGSASRPRPQLSFASLELSPACLTASCTAMECRSTMAWHIPNSTVQGLMHPKSLRR